MRTPPHSPACQRVEALLDQAMSEGVINLPPELQAHAVHCPRCAREYNELSHLLTRLRSAAAGIELGKVPAVVDRVMATPPAEGPRQKAGRPVSATWFLGQLAAVVAAALLMVGGLTYALLKVNEAVGGVPSGRVVERLLTPFQDWTWARFRGTR